MNDGSFIVVTNKVNGPSTQVTVPLTKENGAWKICGYHESLDENGFIVQGF